MTIQTTTTARAPWHVWVVGGLGVLWNSYGCYDFAMSVSRGDPYYRLVGMSEAQIAYMHAMPGWMYGVWALGVWPAIVGSGLILARSRFAVHAFAASLAGFLGSLAYGYLLSDGGAINGVQRAVMNGIILAGCLVFLWYAWAMAKRGVLR